MIWREGWRRVGDLVRPPCKVLKDGLVGGVRKSQSTSRMAVRLGVKEGVREGVRESVKARHE